MPQRKVFGGGDQSFDASEESCIVEQMINLASTIGMFGLAICALCLILSWVQLFFFSSSPYKFHLFVGTVLTYLALLILLVPDYLTMTLICHPITIAYKLLRSNLIVEHLSQLTNLSQMNRLIVNGSDLVKKEEIELVRVFPEDSQASPLALMAYGCQLLPHEDKKPSIRHDANLRHFRYSIDQLECTAISSLQSIVAAVRAYFSTPELRCMPSAGFRSF